MLSAIASNGSTSVEVQYDRLNGFSADRACMVSTVPQVLGTILADTLVHTATADPRLSDVHLARTAAIISQVTALSDSAHEGEPCTLGRLCSQGTQMVDFDSMIFWLIAP